MHAVHRYAKANIKYMKNYDPNAKLSYRLLGFQRSMRMGNLTKVASRWF